MQAEERPVRAVPEDTKQSAQPGAARELPDGGRIWCAGPDSRVKRAVFEALQRVGDGSARPSVCLWEEAPGRAAAGGELRSEDCVLLFGDYAEEGADHWENFLRLADSLEQVRRIRPRQALLLSDVMVYGRVFGAPHPLREDEIGYLSHTSAADMAAQCMRTAEHICCRAAREEGFAIVVVRADWNRLCGADRSGAEDDSRRALQAQDIPGTLLRILLNAEAGEVLNLPAAGQETQCGAHSPLAPLPVIPDARKAGRYVAS